MSAMPRPAFRAVGLVLVMASAAVAQEKACEVNESRPTAIGRATLAVQVASSTQDPASAAKQLSAAVKGLTENAERMDKRKRLHHFLDTVSRANEPTVLPEGSF